MLQLFTAPVGTLVLQGWEPKAPWRGSRIARRGDSRALGSKPMPGGKTSASSNWRAVANTAPESGRAKAAIRPIPRTLGKAPRLDLLVYFEVRPPARQDHCQRWRRKTPDSLARGSGSIAASSQESRVGRKACDRFADVSKQQSQRSLTRRW